MKTIITIVGTIILAVIIVGALILGPGSTSLETGAKNVMNRSNTEINKIVNP